MQNNHPKVSIIILNWNGLKDTLECLESLKKINYSNFEIVVIDNGSKGDDAEEIDKLFGSNIKVIRNKDNLGYAQGMNSAIKPIVELGRSKYILLLNNDTIVDPDFLNALVEMGEKDKKAGIIGSLELSYDDKNRIITIGCNFDNYLFIQRYPCKYIDVESCNLEKYKGLDMVAGSSMMIKNELFEKIGLFDSDYFVYGEEFDFSLKAKRRGYKSVLCPDSKIWHKGEETSGGRWSSFGRYYLTRNRLIFAKKNYSLFHYAIYLIYYLSIFMPVRFFGILYRGKYNLIKPFFKGLRDGINFRMKK